MQKLSIEVVNKMIAQRVTGCEIDFVLYISRFQDDRGVVKGVYYKDVAKETGMSFQQFYNAKQSLQDKGIIRVEKNDYTDHDITILDNSYAGLCEMEEKVRRKPYINTNHDIFYKKKFRAMKPGAKLMALDLMRRTRMNDTGRFHPYKWGVEKMLENYKTLLGVTKRVIRVYLTQLRQFFGFVLSGKIYEIVPKDVLYRRPGLRRTENEKFSEHTVQMACRRNKVCIEDDRSLHDTADLCGQYSPYAKDRYKNIFKVVEEAIGRSAGEQTEKAVLLPKLVHIWVRELLGIEKVKTFY